MPDLDARCWSCGGAIDAADRYCRLCGQGQGDFVFWYYRPAWILVLALTALGPFVLPLIWRTPRLDRVGKWIASIVVVALSAWVGWRFVVAVNQLGKILVQT